MISEIFHDVNATWRLACVLTFCTKVLSNTIYKHIFVSGCQFSTRLFPNNRTSCCLLVPAKDMGSSWHFIERRIRSLFPEGNKVWPRSGPQYLRQITRKTFYGMMDCKLKGNGTREVRILFIFDPLTKRARNVKLMLFKFWISVHDAGPANKFNVLSFLGISCLPVTGYHRDHHRWSLISLP